MIRSTKLHASVRQIGPWLAAGIVWALCVPFDAAAQGGNALIISLLADTRDIAAGTSSNGGSNQRLMFQQSSGSWNPKVGGDRNADASTITCSSDSGQRVYCGADTSGGVRLVRQLSGTPCDQRSWGYDSRGIWVDHGCRAEFDVSGRASNGIDSRDNRRVETIRAGTSIIVRTNDYIDVRNSDGRVFAGVVYQDVLDENRNVAIPRGSNVELIVRHVPDGELALDLESVDVNGQRYAVAADADRADGARRDGVGANQRTGEYAGGGALLGTIIGAIAGGGRGAAIGAAAGAGAGVGTEVLTRGRVVNVPAESLLTFRLEQPLQLAVGDHGFNRDGQHYHDPNGHDPNGHDPNGHQQNR
jgi:hypothetical protein